MNIPETKLLAEVRAAASLAKMAFSPEEEECLCRELGGILGFAAALQQAETLHVPMTAHVASLESAFREDVVVPSFSREDMLRNAPTRTAAFINVPRTFEEGGAEE